MSKKVLYVVNNDSTTSIPLEVAGYIEGELSEFSTVVFYEDSNEPVNNFTKYTTNLEATGVFDLKAILKSLRFIRDNKPDVIHAHHTWSAFLFFLLAKLYCKSAKLIKTEHNDHRFARREVGRWYQVVFNFFILWMADLVICNSESTLKSFSYLERMVTQKQTQVCYNGVNLQAIQNARLPNQINEQLFPVNESNRIIGSVGRLVKEKDYESLIEAFNLIKRDSKRSSHLLLVGDGPEKLNLKDKVSSLELEQYVTFTGTLKRELVYSFLNELDIFVMTSKWEGFCNALVEALAAKNAVVCSDIPALREVAGDAALFAEPGNPQMFANNIHKLLTDKNLFKEMKNKAGQRSDKFSLERCAKQYMSYYNSNK